jgi:hypothetical protein
MIFNPAWAIRMGIGAGLVSKEHGANVLNPLNGHPIDDWHLLALSGDCTALNGMIHDDAVFESPIVHTPVGAHSLPIDGRMPRGHVVGAAAR